MIGQQPVCQCRSIMVHDYCGLFRCPHCHTSVHWLDTDGKEEHRAPIQKNRPFDPFAIRPELWRR